MKSFKFTNQQPDKAYQFAFEESLFNIREHRHLQSSGNWQSFYTLDDSSRTIMASIHFHVDGGIARSPLRAPYGSVEFSKELPSKALYEFVGYFERELKNSGIKSIVIKNFPDAYFDNGSLVSGFLINHGFNVSAADISSIIEVDDESLVDKFHRSEKKRLRKSENENLVFAQLPLEKLQEAYNFILRCRTEKGYELSMTLDQLLLAVEKFPDRYSLFTVMDGNQIAAASIAILVKHNILYEFYHDHAKEFDQLSPVVKLVDGINRYCYQNKITRFDLGTSTIGNLPNFGLLHFKQMLGGLPVSKLTFVKSYTS